MIYPPLDDLLRHVDNRYTLVTVCAKRARKILEENIDQEKSIKPVSLALQEIMEGKIKVEHTKIGIK